MSAVVAGGRENKTRSEYLFVIADIGAKSPLGFLICTQNSGHIDYR